MDDQYNNLTPFSNAAFNLYEQALNASVDGIVITDNQQPDNPIIYCNEAFMRLTGYTYEEIIGHNCRFLQGPEREQPVREIIRNGLQNNQHVSVEIRNYKKDGTPFWNQLSVSPVTDEQGRVTHFIGIQNDITRRKEAEGALQDEKEHLEDRVEERTRDLQESEIYLSSIVETIRESLLVLDPDMRVLSVNEHFKKFFEIEEDKIIGKVLFDFESSWNISELKNLLLNVLPANNPFEGFEMTYSFQGIGKKTLLLNARQIMHKSKYQDRILLAIEDITDMRRMEQRKEDFITIASHEMKTPLTSIKGHLQVLQLKAKRNQDDAYQEPLSAAVRSANRLDGLVNDLLEVARLQSGDIAFHYTKFDFDELVNEAVTVIQSATQTHHISIEGQTGQTVEADFSRLEQVLINLLSNAIKYSPQASQISVKLHSDSENVTVSITDYGMGISKEEQELIFDRFYRADNLHYAFQGMGIGLYICKQIIDEHQGRLWVESEKDKGAIFSFTIPIRQQAK
ncbi:PAS domain S-box protein [Mucilaginibacter sp. Bleaf8]|uniref:PAS domain-containing sensor histidine kinase n=1 Tax=Mucilaginibacter sp. Bleaf8 TaxID=2834430 RepID=UPI001BCB61E8|nr:PAS domain S-box protein [Mucilaginibacter sp. Bleaf8]MBS7564842.1 PAS domain S-box protein [Mucilaginibacter sp. Bleaf8]